MEAAASCHMRVWETCRPNCMAVITDTGSFTVARLHCHLESKRIQRHRKASSDCRSVSSSINVHSVMDTYWVLYKNRSRWTTCHQRSGTAIVPRTMCDVADATLTVVVLLQRRTKCHMQILAISKPTTCLLYTQTSSSMYAVDYTRPVQNGAPKKHCKQHCLVLNAEIRRWVSEIR